MKKYNFISKTLFFIVTFFFVTILASCEKLENDSWERPDDLSPYIPDYSILFTGTWSVSENISSFALQPQAPAVFDDWQLRIKSVDYYIDDIFIETTTQEPYSFVYSVPGLSVGHHQLIAKVKIEDLVSHKEIIISPTKDFEVKPSSKPDTSNGLLLNASYSTSGNNAFFSIDDISLFSLFVDSGWTLITVNYYFDDILVGTLYEKPFKFTYSAKDLSKGNHYFVIKGKIVNTQISQEMELVKELEVTIR